MATLRSTHPRAAKPRSWTVLTNQEAKGIGLRLGIIPDLAADIPFDVNYTLGLIPETPAANKLQRRTSILTKIAMVCVRLGIGIEFCEFLQILKFVAVDIMPTRCQQLSSPSGDAYDKPP